jgi:hypothetical protein
LLKLLSSFTYSGELLLLLTLMARNPKNGVALGGEGSLEIRTRFKFNTFFFILFSIESFLLSTLFYVGLIFVCW